MQARYMMSCVCVCQSVCLSHSGIASKQATNRKWCATYLFCSVLFFNHPRYEVWLHHGRPFSGARGSPLLSRLPPKSSQSMLWYCPTKLFLVFPVLFFQADSLPWFPSPGSLQSFWQYGQRTRVSLLPIHLFVSVSTTLAKFSWDTSFRKLEYVRLT